MSPINAVTLCRSSEFKLFMPVRDAITPETKTETVEPIGAMALIQLIAHEKSSGATMTGRTWFATRGRYEPYEKLESEGEEGAEQDCTPSAELKTSGPMVQAAYIPVETYPVSGPPRRSSTRKVTIQESMIDWAPEYANMKKAIRESPVFSETRCPISFRHSTASVMV
uniref:Uncharacterized protein RSc2139 n=1 Tax=Ganoderma boninense TaxID=34458 RepID=A0A5K1K9E1_9APHY|nr:Uncharacterized protein RSc2139 [Ganoderma boninense]